MTPIKSLLFVITALVLIQLLCFWPIVTHVGFYLDDWATLSYLHFAPKDGGYLGLLHHYFTSDSRVLIRPIEVLHFGTIYFLSGEKPLLYHVVNLVFEAASSLLFYGVVVRLTGRTSLAFIAALFLLLYPSHDSTHYWMICSSVALSLALYLGSLQSSLQAADLYLAGDKNASYLYQTLGLVLFFVSLLNYETFLPLASINVLAVLAVAYRQQGDWRKSLAPALITMAFFAVAAVLFVIFLKVIVPMLGHGYAHAIKLDPQVMCSTIVRGLALNAPNEALPFFLSQAQAAAAALSSSEIIRLVALIAVASGAAFFLIGTDKKLSDIQAIQALEPLQPLQPLLSRQPLRPLDLALLGLFTIFISYTIFGLSPDYMPIYTTLVNRVNTGASLGVVLVLVALMQWLGQIISKRHALFAATLTVAAAAGVLLFSLADWGLAKPWIVSWTTQQQVRDSLAQIKGKIDPTASLLLISCPTYVMWAPVFDGVWDFQNLARITLDQPNFNANVVSGRLSVTPTAIKDVSYGYECGSYKFDKLFLMVAPHDELLRVSSPTAFIEAVEHRGMTFGLDKKTLSKWREQAAAAPKLEPSH